MSENNFNEQNEFANLAQNHIDNHSLIDIKSVVGKPKDLDQNNKSPAATTNFIKELHEKYPDINLAKLFCESLSQLSKNERFSDDAIRNKCASNMRSRIAEKINIAERELDCINFELFASETAKAMKPLRVVIENPNGRKVAIALPINIPKMAEEIASSWEERNKIAQIMLNCVQNDNSENYNSGDKKILFEPIEPEIIAKQDEKKNNIWQSAKNALKSFLQTVKKITIGITISMSLMMGVYQGAKIVAPYESPKAVLQEIGDSFQTHSAIKKEVDSHSKYFSKTIKASVNDKEFDQMISSDFILENAINTFFKNAATKMEQVERINKFWNLMNGIDDIELYKQDEYMAKPSEMWKNKGGDCEDYAVAKYVSLRKMGYSKDDLHILEVKNTKKYGEDGWANHAVLAVNVDGKYVILDNLFEDVLPVEQAREIYKLYGSVNEKGATSYTQIEQQTITAKYN